MKKEDAELQALVEAELDKFGDSITPEERIEMRKRLYENVQENYQAGYVEGYSCSIMMEKLAKKAAELYIEKVLQLPEIKDYQEAAGVNFNDHRGILTLLMSRMFNQGSGIMMDYHLGTKKYDDLLKIIQEMKP